MINEKDFKSSKMKKNLILTVFVFKLILIVNRVHSQSNVDELKYESSTRTNYLKNDLVVRNYNNLTRIEDILELFSVSFIGSQWKEIYSKLRSEICAKDMTEYLSGLEEKKIWAIKSKLYKKRKIRQTNEQTERHTKCVLMFLLKYQYRGC